MLKWLSIIGAALVAITGARAQNGDKKGEAQVPRVRKEIIPAAPPLSPVAALRTFKLPAGFRIELVACEPMVEMPVTLQFDPEGRLWVVEMRGFMPNADGRGEQEPVGRVAVLEDTDGDGRMDKRTTFLDGLIMPRALALVRDGVLIAEPPHLWFCRDSNNDLKCDERIEVANNYGEQKNPEHTANGLLWSLDNWIYSANWPSRIRPTKAGWTLERTTGRGQWGITQDDFGRLFHNSNSDHLRADLVPTHYAAKRRAGLKAPGVNVAVAREQSVWPARVNPGVNRGYQPKQLRPDGTLATFTAACGPVIYRGNNFPTEFYGNAFVCEPAGNLIRRSVLVEQDGIIRATNAYVKSEFLTSTDERFRPVNLYNGPDGALYVVDLYHGILQHRIYMTSYLRHQVEERGLETPQNQGRIYRIVYDGGPVNQQPHLARESSENLVAMLSHEAGWWRDTAQHLLVERRDPMSVSALEKIVREHTDAVARLHALWTLDGMEQIRVETLAKAMSDVHPKVRAAGIRLSERYLKSAAGSSASAGLRQKVLSLASDSEADVQVQLALTLGEFAADEEMHHTLAGLTKSPFALVRESARFSLGAQEKPAALEKKGSAPPLSAADQKRVEAGKDIYAATCIACHQPHGMGQEGLAPPLVGSEWVAGSEQRLIRIVLHGLRGPIKVKGESYELDMPALGVLDDEQIANVLSYVRREWGHAFPPVATEAVKKIRDATSTREDAWTEEELLRLR